MGVFRPLRGALCIYDLFRLILMIGVVVFFLRPANGDQGAVFPLLAYIAPNALFPLMAFFLWRRPEGYQPYLFLYIAGKIVAIMANLGWIVFSYREIILDFMVFDSQRPLFTSGSALVLIVLDGLSVLGASWLKPRALRAARIEGGV
ncbi:MAG: hypothetical protein LBT16_12155 [Treponema sp.]|jgi:hypothetical protein|nr:hypothetical protein [Treponema sp.]